MLRGQAYKDAMQAYMDAKAAGTPKAVLQGMWQAIQDGESAPSQSATTEKVLQPWDYSFAGKEVLRNRQSVPSGGDYDFSKVHHGPMAQSGQRMVHDLQEPRIPVEVL